MGEHHSSVAKGLVAPGGNRQGSSIKPRDTGIVEGIVVTGGTLTSSPTTTAVAAPAHTTRQAAAKLVPDVVAPAAPPQQPLTPPKGPERTQVPLQPTTPATQIVVSQTATAARKAATAGPAARSVENPDAALDKVLVDLSSEEKGGFKGKKAKDKERAFKERAVDKLCQVLGIYDKGFHAKVRAIRERGSKQQFLDRLPAFIRESEN